MGRLQLALHLRLLTPAFIAGANRDLAEFRAPSFKGLLRFWWRATQASQPQMREMEKVIFGSASGGGKGGCSAFTLQVSSSLSQSAITKAPLPRSVYTEYQVKGHRLSVLEYLAYGTYTYQKTRKCNVFNRSYIDAGQAFTLTVRLVNEDVLSDVIRALAVFCAFGSIGAKSRNGFGSFALERVDGDSSVEKLTHSTPPDIFRQFARGEHLPTFTAFSGEARLFRTRKEHRSWDSCLGELGQAYRVARLSLENRHRYDVRQFIGAPLVVNKKQESLLARRAKPYFMRIHKNREGYVGYLLYLPSQYYPKEISSSEGRKLGPGEMTDRFLSACDSLNTALAKSLEAIR